MEVKVPPGVDTGTRLKLSGEGEPAPVAGGAPGDLYVVVQVREHPLFTREDTEILCEMPISFAQAALGAAIDVPTLDGPSKLKVPAGTQTGKVFRLKGKGVPSLQGGGRGRPARPDLRRDPDPPHEGAARAPREVRLALRRGDAPPRPDLLGEGARPGEREVT